MSDSDSDYDWSARKRARSDNSGDDGAAVVAAPAPPAAVPALAIVPIAGAGPPMHAAPALGPVVPAVKPAPKRKRRLNKYTRQEAAKVASDAAWKARAMAKFERLDAARAKAEEERDNTQRPRPVFDVGFTKCGNFTPLDISLIAVELGSKH